MMPTYTEIIASASRPDVAERLHHFQHEGKVDYVTLPSEDLLRHRLRVRTDGGEECGIALKRSEHLFDGAVLRLDASGALVVRSAQTRWLRLRPRDTAAALELGYFAGNMHWAVRFDSAILCVALRAPADDYQQRLQPMLASGGIVMEPEPEVHPNHGHL